MPSIHSPVLYLAFHIFSFDPSSLLFMRSPEEHLGSSLKGGTHTTTHTHPPLLYLQRSYTTRKGQSINTHKMPASVPLYSFVHFGFDRFQPQITGGIYPLH